LHIDFFHPVQGLIGIATGVLDEFQKYGQKALKRSAPICFGNESVKLEALHVG
jgi:hypothetical protein